MSHTPAFALIPGDTPANEIREKLWNLTSKYEEHYTSECIEPCDCVGDIANHKACTKAYNEAIDAVKANKNKAGCTSTPERDDEELSDEDRKSITEKVNAILDLHGLVLTPNPDCGRCGGIGTVAEYYDNYSCYRTIHLGGFYSGLIYGPDRDYDSLQNKELFKDFDDEPIRINCRPVSEVPIEDPFYFANIIFMPDGGLEEHHSGYSFAKPEEEEKWKQHIIDVFKKYSDHLVIALDCRG